MRLVVSPHLDDAVLGAGSYLSEHHEPVLTVFDGMPNVGLLTPYDEACGFASSHHAMHRRHAENRAALDSLGCESCGLGLLDLQYRAEDVELRRLANLIFDVTVTSRCEGIIAPVGIQHPDHVAVSDACLSLAASGMAVWLYEELPYRVVWPETAIERLAEIREEGWKLVPDFLGGESGSAKERAVDCYGSQELDRHCCLVPERFWMLTR